MKLDEAKEILKKAGCHLHEKYDEDEESFEDEVNDIAWKAGLKAGYSRSAIAAALEDNEDLIARTAEDPDEDPKHIAMTVLYSIYDKC